MVWRIHYHVPLFYRELRTRFKRAIEQDTLSKADVDAWIKAMVKKRSANAASSSAFVEKWNGEEARLRKKLLDELSPPVAAGARQERIEETGDSIKPDTVSHRYMECEGCRFYVVAMPRS